MIPQIVFFSNVRKNVSKLNYSESIDRLTQMGSTVVNKPEITNPQLKTVEAIGTLTIFPSYFYFTKLYVISR